jgi:hypothetical protein
VTPDARKQRRKRRDDGLEYLVSVVVPQVLNPMELQVQGREGLDQQMMTEQVLRNLYWHLQIWQLPSVSSFAIAFSDWQSGNQGRAHGTRARWGEKYQLLRQCGWNIFILTISCSGINICRIIIFLFCADKRGQL